MAFMVPVYTRADFHVGETRDGMEAIPASVYGALERFAEETGATECETVSGKWWARLSAPGYMDATEWDGPHDTLEDARQSLSDTFDVDLEGA
jgi:hypothetical protein